VEGREFANGTFWEMEEKGERVYNKRVAGGEASWTQFGGGISNGFVVCVVFMLWGLGQE